MAKRTTKKTPPLEELRAIYRALLETLDAWFGRGVAEAGPGVVPCRASCSACCHGVFDISPADAQLVGEGLSRLPPDQAAALRGRAAEQLAQYGRLRPGWGAPWDVDALTEPVFDALTEQLATAPCPALDAEGRCSIYAHRPATCRMTGLSMDAGPAGRLDNECPIQFDFPEYEALPPVPFDLIGFEREAARHDAVAVTQGAVTTTVAGALQARPVPPIG